MAGPSKVAMRSLLRGKGHLGKEATKFQFDISIDRLHGLQTGPHTMKWSRGAKVAYTKPFQIDRKSVQKLEVGQKLSLLCTLYRPKVGKNQNYDEKDSKLSLVSYKDGKKNEKTIGKIHFNIAEYAGVPSAEASVKFKLNNKTHVEVTIACTFVQISNGTGSSVGSGLSAMSRSSEESEPCNDDFAGNESDNEFPDDAEELFSPVTPVPQTCPFETAKDFFEGNEGTIPHQEDNGRVKFAFSKFSSRSSDKEILNAEQSRLQTKAKTSSPTPSKNKAKLFNSESDKVALRQELAKFQRELTRVQELHRISEEVVLELRQSVSKKELEIKNMRTKQTDTLKRKVAEMNKEIAEVECRTSKISENYEERLRSVQLQVETTTRSKQRLEEELRELKVQQEMLVSGTETNQGLRESQTNVQIDELQNKLDTVQVKFSSEVSRRKGLEEKCADLAKEISRLNSKIQAHQDHAESVKKTYADLSHLYKELREQHVLAQQEVQTYRNGSIDDPRQSSGTRVENERYFFSALRTKTERKKEENKDEPNKDAQELCELRMALSNVNQRLVQAETKNADSQQQCISLSVDIERMTERMEKTQAEALTKSRACEEMKVKYLEACEELEESGRISAKLQKKLSRLEYSHDTDRSTTIDGEFLTSLMTTESAGEIHEKVRTLFLSVLEAKRTIHRMREDLQEAVDREYAYEQEANRLKSVLDGLTPRIKQAFADESTRRKAAEEELEMVRGKAAKAEGSLNEMVEREVHYREAVEKLKLAVVDLEKKSKESQDTSNSALSACRSELKLKQDEVFSLSVRIESLERELSAKKDSADTLSSRIRELELESEIIKKQAQHQVQLAKEETRQADASNTNQAQQVAEYKQEIDNLKVVEETLRCELSESIQEAQAKVKNAISEANENRRQREEVAESQLENERELKKQENIVFSLQEKLREAVESNQKASNAAAEEAQRLLLVFEEKQQVEEHLNQANVSLEEQNGKISELSSTIEELNISLEHSSRRNERTIQHLKKELDEKESLLKEAERREHELKVKINTQGTRLSKVQEQLDMTIKEKALLASQKEKSEVESANMISKLRGKEEELLSQKQTISEMTDDREILEAELSSLKDEVCELHGSVSSLRGQLSESQNNHEMILAASAADCMQTAAELEETQAREETYKGDILRKNELVEDLTNKLTEAVGKCAADSARANAELSEALSREETYKDTIKNLKQSYNDLEEELTTVRSGSALASSGLQAELAEAVSREETHFLGEKRLRVTVKELERELSKVKEDLAAASELQKSSGKLGDNEDDASRRANKAMADVLGIEDDSLSSSNIRKLDVFEKITDARLLEMLVETKMQLAVAEEEKLQLEHLIRRIREGDKHVQEKLAEQAASLELKLTKANQMIDSMQSPEGKRKSRRNGNSSGSACVEREKSMMKGNQLQFFRESSGHASKSKKSRAKNGKSTTETKPTRFETQQDEWDLGDDSHDGTAQSESISRTTGSYETD